MTSTIYTRSEVLSKGDGQSGRPLWLIIDSHVLDITKFASLHPGGVQVLHNVGGHDVTDIFYSLHRSEILTSRLDRLKIGTVKDCKTIERKHWTEISTVPYAEIDMTQSPFYTSSHVALRESIRKFIWESGLYEWRDMAEDSGLEPPRELIQNVGKNGLLALTCGLGSHLKLVPEPNVWSRAGIRVEELNGFHILVTSQEMARTVTPGAEDGICGVVGIGLGPVLKWGSEWMQKQVVPSVLLGEKTICLAISEPYAGSDVAGITTRAIKSPDQSHYIVNGTKKWITNSMFADYFTTLVRIGDSFAMILIERGPGVEVRRVPTSYSPAAGTGLVSFENVVVPARNLIGREGEGLMMTFSNFNGERIQLCAVTISRSRRVLEECFLWASQRRAFGKPLIDQVSVQEMLGIMTSELESANAWLERVVHQFYNHADDKNSSNEIGGNIALLKYRVTRMSTLIADYSCQIFGGRAVTRSGMGKLIERYQKSFKIHSIGGGAENVMLSLGVKQAMKRMPKDARL